MEEKVWFENSRGNKLCGIFFNSAIDKSGPIVISAHGMGSGKHSKTNTRMQELLEERGIDLFGFDAFGYYDSEGDVKKITIAEYVDDIINAYKFLIKNGYSKIGLLGTSFGGVASVIAAKDLGIFCLVLKSPGIGQTSRKKPLIEKDFNQRIWFEAGRHVNCPALIVHGGADKDVELEQATKLRDSIKGSKLEIIQGADHTYSNPKDFEKMIRVIADFIVENL